MKYEQLYKSESWGDKFSYGIEINIANPTKDSESVKSALYKAGDLISEAIKRDFYATSKEAQESAVLQKTNLLACFGEKPIFVKPIPNGYCYRACCEHLSWFLVTTKIGVIKIGWRKRVIEIDWSETDIRRIISDDDVTKDQTMIHAWGYEKAAEYLEALFNEK